MNLEQWPNRPRLVCLTADRARDHAREWINDTRRVLGIPITKLAENIGTGRVTMSNFLNDNPRSNINHETIDEALLFLAGQLKERKNQ